ncbi:MAG: NUDIX domain-containing protein [Acidobacteriaceae bacterium]|nr:NUDIX domain-containing protein [Acidobacteriaceae bacterium]
MRRRPSSRLLIVDDESRLLLFKFSHRFGPLAGQEFWATPGGGLDSGETYEAAARRELFEEVGVFLDDAGPQVAQRMAIVQMPNGEMVEADERFFFVRVDELEVSTRRWTDSERRVMAAHRWWSRDELLKTREQIWPDDLVRILRLLGLWPDE